jgi:hypothetical protein
MTGGGVARLLRALPAFWIIAQVLLVAMSLSAPQGWGGAFVVGIALMGLFLLLVPGSIAVLFVVAMLGVDLFDRPSFDWLLARLWVIAAGLTYGFWVGAAPAFHRYLDDHWPSERFYSRHRNQP